MTPVVLVHGGGFAGSCWELLTPLLEGPVLAVDLPGRGKHPAPLDHVTLETAAASAASAASVAADVDAAGFDELILVGNDLDEDQIGWMLERMVPEAPRMTPDPVDLTPLRSAMPRTWVRTMQDVVVPPDRQARFARNVGDCEVIDLDAAHMCMISRPTTLAQLINDIAGRSGALHSG